MVLACGGSWLVKANLISAGEFAEIAQLTKEAVEIVQQCKQSGNRK
jgi:2-dehydro-3-deoxyphosphogluconate aldolase/(4S)-4-hydroxy-2-oxoglutarate aldolase